MFLHWKSAADRSQIILASLRVVGRVLFSITLAPRELSQDEVALFSTTKTYAESRPPAPASRASCCSSSPFQRPKPPSNIHVCGKGQAATWIGTSYVWASRALSACTWVVNRYQVLTADLEVAFCLFLATEYYALFRTNKTYVWWSIPEFSCLFPLPTAFQDYKLFQVLLSSKDTWKNSTVVFTIPAGTTYVPSVI